MKGIGALKSAGSTAAAPVESKIAVEVGSTGITVGAAVILVRVFTPQKTGLGLLATVRVGLQHQVDFMIVQKPGCIRVNTIAVHQIFGQAGRQLSCSVFTTMDRARNVFAEVWNALCIKPPIKLQALSKSSRRFY